MSTTNFNDPGKPKQFFDSKEHEDSHRSIIKSTSVLSIGTLSSRILGFMRDIVLAKLLGTGFRADAFFVALKIPNLFRDLVGEGATNAAVVPVLSEYRHQKSKEKFWQLVSVILVLGLILLSLITILGILFTPWIIRVIAPGFIAEPDKLRLTVTLTKVMFPYLVFIGLTAYSMGILFTFRSFVVPAFSPCLLNISIIISAWFASRGMEEPVFGLAVGVMIGGFLQLAVQIPPLLKTGWRFKIPRTLNHPGAKKVGRLMIPRMFGSGVYQLTVLVDTFCASLGFVVGAGGISAIYYSNRIIQFPMGIFSIALASAVLPSMSGMAHKKDLESVKRVLIFSLESIFFIMAPTTIMLVILAHPIIQVLFERGEFDAYSTGITSWALMFYALGLFSFGGIKILVTGFHALQDTWTPVKVAAGCLILNGLLNIILMFPLKVGGIALASSIAGSADFLILFFIMDKRLGGLNSELFVYFLKVSLGAFLTGVIVYGVWIWLPLTNEILRLSVIGVFSLIVYQIICHLLHIEQARKIWNWIVRKKIVT